MNREGGRCHHCGAEIAPVERVGRRETCAQCGSDLHCCLNCRFYDPASHNECRETQSERQVDKERGNFCELFELMRTNGIGASRPVSSETRAQLDQLFRKRGS